MAGTAAARRSPRHGGPRPRANASVSPSHPLGGTDPEEVEAVGEHLAGGVVAPQAAAVQVGDLLVDADRAHPAGVVPLVEATGELLEVARDPVRLEQVRG